VQRKARSDARAAAMRVPVPAHLPPVIAEPKVQLRKPAEVLRAQLAGALRGRRLGRSGYAEMMLAACAGTLQII
jgi:hypothetical protein